MELLMWFTKLENTKPLGLLIFFFTFCAILFYVFGNRERGERLESYKNLPFQDE
ncbi:MAG TPA: cbb3-type cytochrome c oxidase subunit 3 [Sulfuricella sp.]|nr:cbb3-type cytochrome c oxidase subunit 3 [Sulfuricella sp.]